MRRERKRREARARYAAAAVGLRLQRSKKRLPCVPETGTYRLVDSDGASVGSEPDGWGLTLDDVERRLGLDPGRQGGRESSED